MAELLERPHHLGRTKCAVIGEKTPDPALPVLVLPVFRVSVPAMHMAVDHKDVVSALTVHVSLSSSFCLDVTRQRNGSGSPRHGRMNHWPPARRALYGQPRNGLAAGPRRKACLRGR